jgi:ketosteroid isomerase-like protein
MSRENVELAQRGYAAFNAAYRTGEFLPAIEEFCDPEIVLTPSGLLPESSEMHGHAGVLQFTKLQAEAFEEMSIEPQDYVDAGDRVVVPVRLGGRARHTGIEIDFSFVHVLTIREGKLARIDVYRGKSEALEAVGL